MLTDLRFAFRGLRATPGFTAVALIVLTLGIGATTAIFSVVDGVALRGLPFPRADRLMDVTETNPSGKGLLGGLRIWLERGEQLAQPDPVGPFRHRDHLGQPGRVPAFSGRP